MIAEQGFSTSALLASQARSFFVVGAVLCIVGCWGVIPVLSTRYMPVVVFHLPAVTIKTISRYCQVYPGKQNCSQLKATEIEEGEMGKQRACSQ